MRLRWMAIAGAGVLALTGIALRVTRGGAAHARAPEAQKDKLSYAMGVEMGKSSRVQGVELDADVLAEGLRDALSGGKLLMSEEDVRATMRAFDGELKQRQAAAFKRAAEANKKQGEAFLSENAKREGVVSLPDGLQYKVLQVGNGKKPGEGDLVECNFRTTLLDGTEFDSSNRRGRPATFRVATLIPGLKEPLTLMPVGSKWEVYVPSGLAYGERGFRADKDRAIGPNSTLIFEVELLAIQPPTDAGKKTAAIGPRQAH